MLVHVKRFHKRAEKCMHPKWERMTTPVLNKLHELNNLLQQQKYTRTPSIICRATAREIDKNLKNDLEGRSNSNTPESYRMIWRVTATEIHQNSTEWFGGLQQQKCTRTLQNDLEGNSNRNTPELYRMIWRVTATEIHQNPTEWFGG